MARIEDEVNEGSGESGEEDGCARDWDIAGFGLEEEEGKSGEKGEHHGGNERVEVGASESEIGGGAEVGAKEVGVGDCPREDDRDRGGAGKAREGGALESKRGQGVGEGIHRGEVIS